MTFLYYLTRFITFPGAVTRAFWEQVICRIHKIAVEDNRYLRADEMSSHIEHELTEKVGVSFTIGFVPMLFQFITALLAFLAPLFDIFYLGAFNTAKMSFFGLNTPIPYFVLDIISLWLCISLLCNCFPSIEDALNMKEKIYRKETNIITKIILSPGFAICFIGSFFERYCLTFVSTLALLVLAFIKI